MKATQVRVLRLFFLLSYLAVCISAVGPLGIQWNKDMATRDGVQKMVWMSVIDFGTEIDEKTISNEQLAGLAKKAWNEMKADFDNKPWKDSGVSNSKAGQVPTVMVALTRGTKIYFSSSMRSCSDDKIGYAYSSILSPPPVQMGLYSCALLTENGDRHRTGGNCGEQMAAVLVFNDVSDGKQDLAGSRVVAWINNKDGGKVIPPCGGVPDDSGFVRPDVGCKTFVAALKLTEVPEGTQTQDTSAEFKTQPPCVRLFPAGK